MEQTIQQIRKAIETRAGQVSPEETTFFGQKVWIWPLSSYEMEAWRAYVRSDDEDEVRKNVAKLVQMSIRTEDGSYIYPASAVNQIAGFRPARELDRIEEIALRINGYSTAGIEAILKNLEMTPGGSGSPESPGSTNAAKES